MHTACFLVQACGRASCVTRAVPVMMAAAATGRQEDWGELNTGKRAPAVFVLDLASYSVKRAVGLPEDVSAGQPVWTPDGAAPHLRCSGSRVSDSYHGVRLTVQC